MLIFRGSLVLDCATQPYVLTARSTHITAPRLSARAHRFSLGHRVVLRVLHHHRTGLSAFPGRADHHHRGDGDHHGRLAPRLTLIRACRHRAFSPPETRRGHPASHLYRAVFPHHGSGYRLRAHGTATGGALPAGRAGLLADHHGVDPAHLAGYGGADHPGRDARPIFRHDFQCLCLRRHPRRGRPYAAAAGGSAVFRGAFSIAGACFVLAMLAFILAPVPEAAFDHPPEAPLFTRMRTALSATYPRTNFGRFVMSYGVQILAISSVAFLRIMPRVHAGCTTRTLSSAPSTCTRRLAAR